MTVTVIVVAETKVEPVLAKAVGIGTAFLLNFILNRYFVFGVVPHFLRGSYVFEHTLIDIAETCRCYPGTADDLRYTYVQYVCFTAFARKSNR